MLRLLVIVVSRVIRAARRRLPAALVWLDFVSRGGFAQDLVLQGSLVTMADDGVIEDGSVWIRDGVIDAVFETDRAVEEAVGAKEGARLRTNAWIFPRFINLHTTCRSTINLFGRPTRSSITAISGRSIRRTCEP